MPFRLDPVKFAGKLEDTNTLSIISKFAGKLEDTNTLSIISDIQNRCVSCPLAEAGNDEFLGAGVGLPNGQPELLIDQVPSADGDGIRQITVVVDDEN